MGLLSACKRVQFSVVSHIPLVLNKALLETNPHPDGDVKTVHR